MSHELYMRMCVELCEKGIRNAMPNPCVGAILVRNGKVIGKGITEPFGGAHAEVVAINSVSSKASLKDCTLYVTMEPCCHTGKTPPCSDLILETGIKTVVVGARDPFDKVNGQGIEQLLNAGVKVIEGILEQECIFVNRRFYNFHINRRPYVILKWAETKDGFIDKKRSPGDIGINWITGEETNKLTHHWRSREVAIAIGTNTAENDNPRLTTRHSEGRNPLRIVIDGDLRLNRDLHLFDGATETIVFNKHTDEVLNDVEYVKIEFEDLVSSLLNALTQRGVMSVIIEGGRQFLQSFIDQSAWDEIRYIIGNVLFKEGIPNPKLKSKGHLHFSKVICDDQVNVLFNKERPCDYNQEQIRNGQIELFEL